MKYVLRSDLEAWRSYMRHKHGTDLLSILLQKLHYASVDSNIAPSDSPKIGADLTSNGDSTTTSKMVKKADFMSKLGISDQDWKYLCAAGVLKGVSSKIWDEPISDVYLVDIFDHLLPLDEAAQICGLNGDGLLALLNEKMINQRGITDTSQVEAPRVVSLSENRYVISTKFYRWAESWGVIRVAVASSLPMAVEEPDSRMTVTEFKRKWSLSDEDFVFLLDRHIVAVSNSGERIANMAEDFLNRLFLSISDAAYFYQVPVNDLQDAIRKPTVNIRVLSVCGLVCLLKDDCLKWCSYNILGESVEIDVQQHKFNHDLAVGSAGRIEVSVSAATLLHELQMREEDLYYLVNMEVLQRIERAPFGSRFLRSETNRLHRHLLSIERASEIYKISEEEFLERALEESVNGHGLRVLKIAGQVYFLIKDCLSWSNEDASGGNVENLLRVEEVEKEVVDWAQRNGRDGRVRAMDSVSDPSRSRGVEEFKE